MVSVSYLHSIYKSHQQQYSELVAYCDMKYEGFTKHDELNLRKSTNRPVRFLTEMSRYDCIPSGRGQGGVSLCTLLRARWKESETSQGRTVSLSQSWLFHEKVKFVVMALQNLPHTKFYFICESNVISFITQNFYNSAMYTYAKEAISEK